MKRITQTSGFPEQGAVFRDLTTLDKDCFSFVPPESITPPGCILFSTTDNSFGTIPQRWAGDQFIDPFSWDYRFSTAYSIPQQSDFTDLWGNLDTNIQVEIDIEGCYCPGEGIDRKILAQGVPHFPQVEPLPFAWINRPTGGGGGGAGSATTIIPGSAPKLEEVCPCDIVFDSDALTMYASATSATNTFEVGMRGTIKIPYTDYTGPFAGCLTGGSVVIQEGRISIDELDHSFGGGAVAGLGDGDEVVLKFTWNWGPYPCKGETITDVEVVAGPAAAYRTDSGGAETSEFKIIIGKVVALDNGSLCYEQYQIGDVLLEGVEIPQENIFELTDVNDFTEEPPINSTYVRLWNGTAFNAGTSDCYPQFGALKFLYRVLCSSGDETPGFLHEKVSECISFPSGIIYSTIVEGGLHKANDDFGMDFDNAGTAAALSTDEIFHGVGATVHTNTLADINKILNFIRLADTPATYTGNDGKFLKVSGNKLVFTSAPAGGESNSVIDLGGLELVGDDFGIQFNNMQTDGTPEIFDFLMYEKDDGVIRTNTIEEFNDIMEFIRLVDTPDTYTGNDGKFLKVSGTALVFTSAPSGAGESNSAIINGGLEKDVNDNFGLDFDNAAAAGAQSTDKIFYGTGTTIFTNPLSEINKILNFIRLADTPAAYAGNDGKFLKVDGNKLVFTSAPTGGGASYSAIVDGGLELVGSDFGLNFDNAGTTAAVLTDKIFNGTTNTVNATTLSDINAILQFIRLVDTPTTYTGFAGKFAVVNPGETALSFADAPTGGVAQSVIVNGGLQLVNSDFGMNMANTVGASPDATAQLYFENGGDGVPEKATLAALLGTLGVDGTINITDDVLFDTGTGVFKKIRRTGVVITDGIITDLGTLGSATVFTAVSCSS